jgi:two-component system chemotaxis sensor kinase CheA
MFESGFQELLDEFLLEARERADEVETLLLQLTGGSAEARSAALAQAKRELHTLKGNSGMMGFSNLQQLAHQMEDQVEELNLEAPVLDEILANLDLLRYELESIRATSAAAGAEDAAHGGEEDEEEEAAEATPETVPHSWDTGGSVRVSFAKIDHLVELQAETLIFRNRLADAIERGLQLSRMAAIDGDLVTRCLQSFEEVEVAQQALGKTLNLLQEQVMDLSLVPLQNLFRSLRRLVHDESNREGKKVELVIQGGETPIDKTLLEAAGEALGHLVRNAVIHGIESPEKRRDIGKPETGRVRLSATLEASEVRIEISDDGAGIDLAGLERQAKRLHGRNLAATGFALLFEEGLSTRGGADLSAGRGVGLSAVKKSVERLGGRINVRSEPGQGTTFALRLPVTASILRSLLLSTDQEVYALPLTAVAETVRLDGKGLHSLHDKSVVRWRGRTVSILDLGQLFGTADYPRAEGFLVVIEINGRYRALAIDSIVGIHDIVVKGLDSIVGQPAGISGSTILGDGRVVMILDPASLATLPPSTIVRETTA